MRGSTDCKLITIGASGKLYINGTLATKKQNRMQRHLTFYKLERRYYPSTPEEWEEHGEQFKVPILHFKKAKEILDNTL